MEENVIRLTEDKFYELVESSVKKIVTEAVNKQSIIRKLYNTVQKYTRNRFHDTAWQGVDKVLKGIEDAGFEVHVSVKDGGYRNSMGGNTLFAGDDTVSYWKEFDLEIPVDGKTIYGRLNANAAGTKENPFEYYDVTCTFW